MKPMSAQRGLLYVTKVAAAQRQLNAAIRMTLSGEDELAIHTVAAASFRLLRDIKQKRGRTELTDQYGRGLYHIARDIVAGKGLPRELADAPEFVRLIEGIVHLLQNGEVESAADVSARMHLNPGEEQAHWRKFNEFANFLKHADLDSGGVLPLDNLNNDRILLEASAAYIEVMGSATPEMVVFSIYYFGEDPGFITPLWSAEMSEMFKSLSPAKRRRFCLSFLRGLKRSPQPRSQMS
jgi:hypothetical protein